MSILPVRLFAYLAYCLPFTAFTLLFQPTFAQLDYLTSTADGSSYEVCLEGNYLYVGAANTLKVFELNGPQHTPGTNTYNHRLPSNIDQLLVKDGYLYVCANHAGLWKFDISPNPAMPTYVSDYQPVSIHESIYDVAFYGDSLVVAAKNKVILLSDSAGALTYIATIKSYPDSVRVHGVDIKGNLLAYTVGFSDDLGEQGVYLVNLGTLQEIGFFNQTEADAWEIYFAENDSILHVMGGTYFITGLYYALDYSTPNAMQVVFKDTLPAWGNTVAIPMSAEIIHDTLYIATQGAATLDSSTCCRVYVYDATTPSNITLIEDLTGGLYHFDIEVDEATRTMYVASEWYGILTVDISDISNEVILDKRLTGGWCHGSAFAKDRLVEASEGYGVRLFDMTVRQSPTLIAEDTTVGFCRAISMDDSAHYVYGWFLTDERLRVYDARTLDYLGDTSNQVTFFLDDFLKSRIHGNYVAVIEDPTSINLSLRRILVADITNRTHPFIRHVHNKVNLEDLLFLPSGKLVALAMDSLIVFDPATMNIIDTERPPLPGLQRCKAMTYSNDSLYVFYEGFGEGIAPYSVHPTLDTLQLHTAHLFTMKSDYRIFMATNDTVLYIASSLDSLKAISILPPHNILAAYDHSADHMYDRLWGVTDLYYSQGLLVLNEYHGQSSLFGAPSLVSVKEPSAVEKGRVYPNPAHDGFAVRLESPDKGRVEVYDLNGRLRYTAPAYQNDKTISTNGWSSGMYFVVWKQAEQCWTGKLVLK